jgi:hypothetical protein
MAGDEDRLRAVLTQVDVALFAARLARPTDGVDAVKKALSIARADLESILEDAMRHPGKRPATREDDVKRRDLLRYGLAVPVAGVTPLDALWKRLAAPLPTRVDAGLLNALEATTASYAKGFYTALPAHLGPLVRGHMNRVQGLMAASMTPGQRQRLGSILADTSAFAGWLALDEDRKGEARAFMTLAREAAQQAGARTLYALATASYGLMHSDANQGERGAAAWYLSQAARMLPDHAPDYARAWLNAHLGKEHAALGERYPYFSALEHVDTALQRGQEGEPVGGFFSRPGWFADLDLPTWRDDFAGRGLAYLGHDDAGTMLADSIDAATDARQVATLHISLSQWHVGRGEPEEAAQAAMAALGSTRGLPLWRGRIRVVRGSLDPWADLPAVRDLDDALTLTA